MAVKNCQPLPSMSLAVLIKCANGVVAIIFVYDYVVWSCFGYVDCVEGDPGGVMDFFLVFIPQTISCVFQVFSGICVLQSIVLSNSFRAFMIPCSAFNCFSPNSFNYLMFSPDCTRARIFLFALHGLRLKKPASLFFVVLVYTIPHWSFCLCCP